MMPRAPRFKVHLKPRVVRWLVKSSGMDHSAIARKMRVDRPQVDGWADTGVIEYSKMRSLAKCIRRPETLFLLGAPPKEEALTDYRMARDAPKGLSPEDIVVARCARYAQSAAMEMMEEGGASAEPLIAPRTAASDRPGDAAQAERGRLLGDAQPGGALGETAGEIYGKLREGIEAANVIVLQYPMDTGSVRGLSMTRSKPCVILVNSMETDEARAFTLLHEYGHVLLGKGGVCDEHGAVRPRSDKRRAEAWCDLFAASFLMPEAAFTTERLALEKALRGPSKVIDGLAKKFKTSRYASAVRAAGLSGAGRKAGYRGLLDQIAGRHSRRAGGRGAKRKGDPGLPEVVIARMGQKFVRLALSSHDRGDITTRDLLDYLDMNLEHLDALQAWVARHGGEDRAPGGARNRTAGR